MSVETSKRKDRASRPWSYRTTRAFEHKAATPNWTRRDDKSQTQTWNGEGDPLEDQVEAFLRAANEPFYRNHESRIDFYLPRLSLFIECKRFYTPRISDQLSRVPSADVIVVQGIGALEKLLEVASKLRK